MSFFRNCDQQPLKLQNGQFHTYCINIYGIKGLIIPSIQFDTIKLGKSITYFEGYWVEFPNYEVLQSVASHLGPHCLSMYAFISLWSRKYEIHICYVLCH